MAKIDITIRRTFTKSAETVYEFEMPYAEWKKFEGDDKRLVAFVEENVIPNLPESAWKVTKDETKTLITGKGVETTLMEVYGLINDERV